MRTLNTGTADAARAAARVAGLTGALISAVLFCACGAPEPESGALRLTVGVHEIRLVAPEDWQHVDHGREQRFESGLSQISLADMGPVTRDGFEREIVHARELERKGQRDDAIALLNGLRLRALFPNEDEWRALRESLNVLRGVGNGRHTREPWEADRAWDDLLDRVRSLPVPDASTRIAEALERVGHDERRDVAWKQARTIDGREAVTVDTWDRLNHTGRKRHLVVLNDGNLLVARMELGEFADMESAFDALVDSLGFREDEGPG